jgi:hypothetical protein
MLTDPKVETRLMRIMAEFSGMVLRNARFKEVYAGGRDIVIVELTFSSKTDFNTTRTAVLALDRQITLEEHTEVVEKLLEK